MNYNNTITYPVVLKTKPVEKPWSVVDKTTGETRSGSVHVLRATLVPNTPNVDADALQEIEFNISTSKKGNTKKNLSDILELYFDNRDKFQNGEVYAKVQAYMAQRRSNGVITFFSPWINDVEIVAPNEEDKPLVKAALFEPAPADM